MEIGRNDQDLLLEDLASTTAVELLGTFTSNQVYHRLRKALIRYVLARTLGEIINRVWGDTPPPSLSGAQKLSRDQAASNVAFLALSQNDKYPQVLKDFLHSIGFARQISDVYLASNILIKGEPLYGRLLDESQEKVQEIIKATFSGITNTAIGVDPELQLKLFSVIQEIQYISGMEPESAVNHLRSLIFRNMEIPAHCTDEYSERFKDNFRDCLPGVIAQAILENISYDKQGQCLVFDTDQAIAPLIHYAGHIGGRSNFFFHLVVGIGSAYFEDKSEFVPMVAEQIGFGYAPESLRTSQDEFVTKFGVFASGLLYRAAFDNVESEAVYGGVFVAFDLYKMIQLNLSAFTSVHEDENVPSEYSSRKGFAAGIYIPLDEYLMEIGNNNRH